MMNQNFLLFIVLFLISIIVIESFQFPLLNKQSVIKQTKSELLELSRKTKRGLIETPAEKLKIKDLFEKLEKLNSNKNTLSSPYLSAVWNLEYTTSESIRGDNDSPKVGNILQTIDAKNLKAENSEVVKYFNFLNVPRKVTAKLTPLTPSKVKVQFQVFSVGPINIKSPPTAVGELDITYLDEDLRLSRGDKGNIFVLTKLKNI